MGFYGLTITDDRVVDFLNNTINGDNNIDVGYYFSNVPSANVSIEGGSVNDVTDYGVLVVNGDATWGAGDAQVTIDGADINMAAGGTGVRVYADPAYSNTAHVTVQGDTQIATGGTGTGIKVEGANASADIVDNVASIHGNAIGIDVDGGQAAISNNHIYDNTTGIRFTDGGTGTVDDNDFEGDPNPDNGTDILYTVTAGPVTAPLTGNTFAGSTYIDNRSPHDITALRTPGGTNDYNVAGVPTTDDFAIEGRIYHKVDDASSGLVTWVANTIFVPSVAVTSSTPSATDNDYTRIKNAIEAAGSGFAIQLLGTFDWTEVNAAASWALGNDGVASTVDDYSILVPDGLEDVTFTAPSGLGTATIVGPGEEIGRAGGFLAFRGGVNTGWTISELEIENFEYAIGFFFGGWNTCLRRYHRHAQSHRAPGRRSGDRR